MFIITAKEMYAIDDYTKNEIGFKNLLMENAGRAVSDNIRKKVKETDAILIFTGTGNNGGDGYVIARTLLNLNYQVAVIQVGQDERLTEETYFHKHLYLNCGGTLHKYDQDFDIGELISNYDIIVDAMLGIGIKGYLKEPFKSIVSLLNNNSNYVISVDLPTGLPSDEVEGEFIAIEADYTIIIGAPKPSAYLEMTSIYYGDSDIVSIGHPQQAFEMYGNRLVWTTKDVHRTMPRRHLNSHKGQHGRGLVVGGNDSMPGALALATRAAVKSGAGLMTAATTEKVIDRVASITPEVMYVELEDEAGYIIDETSLNLDQFDAIAVGVGIGRTTKTNKVFGALLKRVQSPLIIDADGLYHLKFYLEEIKQMNTPIIITPHPGEMAHLIDIPLVEIKKRPFYYAQEFAKKYNVYVILKGRFTIITSPFGMQAVNTSGNPGLAKGGSGDVLTGIVLATIMQGENIFHALCNSCFIHGQAADFQVENTHSYYDLSAMDVIDGLSQVYRMQTN